MNGKPLISSGQAASPKVSSFRSLAYSLPVLCTTFLVTPVWSALPGIYAKYFGLSLSVIASVMLMGRLFDAASDPVVGYLSDRYRVRTGTRKPFMVMGGLLFIISGYFLYVPPKDVGVIYFLAWSLAFYLSWTAFQIPHLTWGGELTRDATEKSKIYSFRAGAVYMGLLLFYAVPLLPVFDNTDITPETLKWSAIGTALFLPPLLYLCMKWVPNGFAADKVDGLPSPDSCSEETPSPRALLNILLNNKPFLIFLGAYIFFGTSIGMWYGLIFIYVDAYLGMGSQFAPVFMLSFAVSIPLIPVWYKVSACLGKKKAWIIATGFFIVACLYTACLNPGETQFVGLLVLKIITDIGFVCLEIIPPSMLSDIVDYSTWKFRVERRGTYFSVYVFVTKTTLALGAALGLAIAGIYGFDPAASSFIEEGVFGLKLAIAWLPAGIMLMSLAFILLTPITARHHQMISKRLQTNEGRAQNKSATAAATCDLGPLRSSQ